MFTPFNILIFLGIIFILVGVVYFLFWNNAKTPEKKQQKIKFKNKNNVGIPKIIYNNEVKNISNIKSSREREKEKVDLDVDFEKGISIDNLEEFLDFGDEFENDYVFEIEECPVEKEKDINGNKSLFDEFFSDETTEKESKQDNELKQDNQEIINQLKKSVFDDIDDLFD